MSLAPPTPKNVGGGVREARVDIQQQRPRLEELGHEADGEVRAYPARADVGPPVIHRRQARETAEALDRGAGDARLLRRSRRRREGRSHEGHEQDG